MSALVMWYLLCCVSTPLLVTIVTACSRPLGNSCGGITCGDHGFCESTESGAACRCDPGYHAVGVRCEVDSVCGNGVAEADEQCDGSLLDGTSCESLGFYGGTLSCGAQCTLVLTDCEVFGRCGDGVLQPSEGEQCDSDNLNGESCVQFGFTEGALSCSDACAFDLSTCSPSAVCGDGVVQYPEICDDGNRASRDGCSSGCTVEVLDWVEVTTAEAPSPRSRAGIAYDLTRARVLLFGGLGLGDEHLADTWEFDGTTWMQVGTLSMPGARLDAKLTYDAIRGVVIMHGGFNWSTGNLADTWEYDGTNWTEVVPPLPTQVPGYYGPLVYDQSRELTVLHSDGTWEFNGSTWTHVTPVAAPLDRNKHDLAYDSDRSAIVLFGGWDNHGNLGLLQDTWEFVGTNWTQITTASSPSARCWHSLVYDAWRGRTTVYGGGSADGSSSHMDTWEYDGTEWTQQLTEHHPAVSIRYGMVYDTARRRTVLFGGTQSNSDPSSATWEYYYASSWPDEVCDNLTDDDFDGLTDCADPDCYVVSPLCP